MDLYLTDKKLKDLVDLKNAQDEAARFRRMNKAYHALLIMQEEEIEELKEKISRLLYENDKFASENYILKLEAGYDFSTSPLAI